MALCSLNTAIFRTDSSSLPSRSTSSGTLRLSMLTTTLRNVAFCVLRICELLLD